MCGIAGIVKSTGAVSEKKIKAMTDIMSHRGPDDAGIHISRGGEAGLGHRRLSILDLSSAGHQPMSSADKRFWLVFNGEIYNYLELKKELGGKFQSSSDTEVLLASYQKWGKECVKRFNGIFAFAIWDERERELFCARDHLGVKPFYYAAQNGVFYFASEIKALLAAGVRTKPNDGIIYEYLSRGYYQHSPETFFAGVRELPAGHSLVFKKGAANLGSYWNAAERITERSNDLKDKNDKEINEEFLHIFDDAVRLQLRSDVPMGIQLSGGLDSSILTALVNKANSGQKNFNLFSFVYGDRDEIDKPYMLALAKKLGWKLNFLRIAPRDMSDLMEEVVWHQEVPFPGLPTFGQHMISKACKNMGIKVIFGGQGGDEIGAGYEYYMGAGLLDIIKESGARSAMEALQALNTVRPFESREALSAFFINALGSYLRPGASADGTVFTDVGALRPDFAASQFPMSEFPNRFDSHLNNMQYRDIFYTKLPRILHAADRSAMAEGVEHRVPFLDHRLVEFCLALPVSQKIRNGHQRFFMRNAMSGVMPRRVVWAPKRAVPSPQRKWFGGELRPWIRSTFSSASFAGNPYLDQKKVLEGYDRYCLSDMKNSFHIWQWLHLEHWLKKYFY